MAGKLGRGPLNFLWIKLSYFLCLRLDQAESLMACFVVVTDVQPEIRCEVTRKVGFAALISVEARKAPWAPRAFYGVEAVTGRERGLA